MIDFLKSLGVSVPKSINKLNLTGITSDPDSAFDDMIFCPTNAVRYKADISHAYRHGCRVFLVRPKTVLPKGAIAMTANDPRTASFAIAKRMYPINNTAFITVSAERGITTYGLFLADLMRNLGLKSAFADSNGAIVSSEQISFPNSNTPIDTFRHLSTLAMGGCNFFVINRKSPVSDLLGNSATQDVSKGISCSLVKEFFDGIRPASEIIIDGSSYIVGYPAKVAVSSIAAAIYFALSLGYSPDKVAAAARKASSIGRMYACDFSDIPCVIDSARTYTDLSFIFGEYSRFSNDLIAVIGSVGMYARERRTEIAKALNEYGVRTVITSDDPGFEPAEKISADIFNALANDIEYKIIPDRRTAVREAFSMANMDSIVLLLGKGYENYQLIGTSKLPYDDLSAAKAATRCLRT